MKSIGIDLGTHSIKIVELRAQGNGIFLDNFAVYESEKLVLDLSNPESTKTYANKIKQFYQEVGFESKIVNLSLPENEIFLNIKSLPKMKPQEIQNYISLQSAELFPEKLSDLSYDYKILGEDSGGLVEVLFVGAKKSKVEGYLSLIHQAGLTPSVFEAKTQSISRIIDNPKEDSFNLILDLGYNFTTLHISQNKIPRFTKTIPIGSSSMNRALIQNLNLSQIQAENFKKSYGLNPSAAEGKVYNFLYPLIDSVVLDIKRSIVYFLDKNRNSHIGKIYLIGGLSKLVGLTDYLEKKLNYHVEIFNPFTKIKVGSNLAGYERDLAELYPSLVGVLGLATVDIL